MGGGFGGGHMGGFGGGHAGGFGGHLGGIGGGAHAGLVPHVGHGHIGIGRRRFVGGGFYGYGLGCSYYPNYASNAWPYTCTY